MDCEILRILPNILNLELDLHPDNSILYTDTPMQAKVNKRDK